MILQGSKRIRVTWSALILTATCAHAGNMGGSAAPLTNYNNIQFSAAGGANWYNVSNTSLVISPFETDSTRVNSISTNGAWKAGVGYYLLEDTLSQRAYLNHLLLEANVYQTYTTLSGNVWQFQLPEFNNYSFRAPITSTRLMLDVKPSLFTWSRVSPYAILGVGATWNSVSYHETIKAPDVSPDSALSLSNNTTRQVAWDVGAGLSVSITDYLSATAEYIYTFLGHGSPANRPGNNIRLAAAPSFSLQTQSLLFGLSLRL